MTGPALRRLVHASSALLLLLVPLTGWATLAGVVTSGVVVGWALEVARLRSARVRARLSLVLPVFRPAEQDRPCGAAWLGAGYAIAVWLPPPAPAAAILVAALADPIASLVGGLSTADVGKKTWRGSTAFLLVACTALAALRYPWPVVVGVALLATVAERWSTLLDDNLLVPTLVAVAVTLLA